MSTGSDMITVSNIPVEIVRKDIKNIHLGVYPPEGKVRISVPRHITDDNVRLAIASRLPWIRKRQEELRKQPRQTEREYVSGESHYYQGRRYILRVVEGPGRHFVSINNNAKMVLHVQPGTSKDGRARAVHDWYRQQLKASVAVLLEKWQPVLGKKVQSWGVKKMKTKWGSCNIADRRIWINLELAKKSPECLEYILVHELVHLHERHHNEKFRRLMDRYLPSWRKSRDVLQSQPLAYEEWVY
ncbi:MAG: M48 family metallopeptidase [Rhodospirillales bacterium]|nr:M48 family metallopeptidase [Rhodospirillales bacterium]